MKVDYGHFSPLDPSGSGFSEKGHLTDLTGGPSFVICSEVTFKPVERAIVRKIDLRETFTPFKRHFSHLRETFTPFKRNFYPV